MFRSTKLDKYGRPLGHVYYGEAAGTDFGAVMVEQGHAVEVD